MTRTPLTLAALASAAVSGLDPATVKGVLQLPGHQFEVAFIEDTQHRRWVVRAPKTAAAGAQMDVSVSLFGLFGRRLPFSVPAPRGFVTLNEGGRAVVYPYIPGRPLDFAKLPDGPGIAAELGKALAALHNLDLALCEEAGLTSYDPDTYRTRRLSDLDRAAATGHVPSRLLSRWEASLEDVSLWRFAPTPTHGDLTGDEVLAVFDDNADATTGHIRGLTGWENAKIADPADDFATLVTHASPEAFDTVLEAYSHARADRPDKYLERRARLAGELKLVSQLLTAVGSGDKSGIEVCADKLRTLDADTVDDQADEPVTATAPARPAVPVESVVAVDGVEGVKGVVAVEGVDGVVMVDEIMAVEGVVTVDQVTAVDGVVTVDQVTAVDGVVTVDEVEEIDEVDGADAAEDTEVLDVREQAGQVAQSEERDPGEGEPAAVTRQGS